MEEFYIDENLKVFLKGQVISIQNAENEKELHAGNFKFWFGKPNFHFRRLPKSPGILEWQGKKKTYQNLFLMEICYLQIIEIISNSLYESDY